MHSCSPQTISVQCVLPDLTRGALVQFSEQQRIVNESIPLKGSLSHLVCQGVHTGRIINQHQ